MLIDSHAHLNFADYQGEIPAVLDRAKAAGVSYIINVGLWDEKRNPADAIALAHKYPQVFATVGVHPHDVKLVQPDSPRCSSRLGVAFGEARAGEAGWIAQLEEWAKDEKVVAIGEVGLDYFYEHSERELQKKYLREFVQLARRVKLPLVIHCRASGSAVASAKASRDAYDDMRMILTEEKAKEVGGVMHCFSGDAEFAAWAIQNNFKISFSGVITFKKTEALQKVAKEIPDDQLLVETDCPFLAPVPYRGKRNEPAYVKEVAYKLAELRHVSIGDIERMTTRNARDLFHLPLELPDDEPKIAYSIRNSLYLNITNECTLACRFCPKFSDWMVKGHYLKLPAEPSEEKLIQAIGDPTRYKEIVFCGFGESTLRLDLLKRLARWIHEKGTKVRLDTDGLGNLVHGRNIVPELKGLVDAVSVSLNAADAKTYAKLCPNKFGEAAYPAVKDFILKCRGAIPDITASVVGVANLDATACRKIVEEELGVKFRLRPYDVVG